MLACHSLHQQLAILLEFYLEHMGWTQSKQEVPSLQALVMGLALGGGLHLVINFAMQLCVVSDG